MISDNSIVYRRAISMINSEAAMVLSTLDISAGIPWSATVYFFYDKGSFYFFSSPKSKHIKHSKISKTVAVSIFSQRKCWSAIRGVQMLGQIKEIKPKNIPSTILKKYFLKFNLSKDLFSLIQKKKIFTSFEFLKKTNINFYEFKSHSIIYSDNFFGFGFKKNITLD